MRKPETIEKLYLDFDGFFASVMQQAFPRLRGRPIGIIPFETDAADRTIVIVCSKEAKAADCKNVMPVPEARDLSRHRAGHATPRSLPTLSSDFAYVDLTSSSARKIDAD